MRNTLYIITDTLTGDIWNGSILGSGDWGMRVSHPAHIWGYQIDIWDEASERYTLEKAYGPLPRRG